MTYLIAKELRNVRTEEEQTVRTCLQPSERVVPTEVLSDLSCALSE